MKRACLVFFYIFAVLSILTNFLALSNVFINPEFNKIAVTCLYLMTLFGFFAGFRKDRKAGGQIAYCTLLPILLFGLVTLISFCFYGILNPRQQHEEYLSPNGTHTLIMEYDFMDHPIVYEKKNQWMMKKVYGSRASNYLQSSHFMIDWISEDRFRIYSREYPYQDYSIVDLPPAETTSEVLSEGTTEAVENES